MHSLTNAQKLENLQELLVQKQKKVENLTKEIEGLQRKIEKMRKSKN